MVDNKIHVAQVIGRVTEGGVEKMITEIYKHIDRTKVVFDFFVENTSIIVNKEELENLGGKVFIIPSYKHYFKFKKTLKKYFLDNKYDIVHVNMNSLSFIALKVAKKCGIKVRISHSHSSSNKKEFKKHLLKMLLRPFAKRNATHYFACSELAGRWLFGNKLYDSGKIEIINNAIDIDKYRYNSLFRKEIRDRLHIPEDSKVIGHIGRFCKQKNHEYLINIFKDVQTKLPDAHLLLVGDGELFDQIKEYVRTSGVKNVIFVGPTTEAYKFYNAMDIFVLPSLYEGLPVVGVEAQANMLKCLFSTEVTEEAKLLDTTEFLELSTGPDEWSNKIVDFLSRSSKRNNAGFSDKFDIKKISSRILNLYKTYLNK